jgi:catechol 2,3-dioxygenase-like lactoylglutathione lyase family enzyme
MLQSQPLVAFVATTDPPRAKNFYATTLGLRLVSEDSFALVFDAAGTMLRVTTVPELQPAGYTVLGWVVPDIQNAVRALQDRGVEFRRYGWMSQDEQGIWMAPGGAQVAWFGDPDGNTLSLTQMGGRAGTRAKAVRSKASAPPRARPQSQRKPGSRRKPESRRKR